MLELNRIYNKDCLEALKKLPDNSVDLCLTDPPYNIHKSKDWDIIDQYPEWMMQWIKEVQRVLKPNGVFYFWHNDIAQASEILHRIKSETDFVYRSMCVWNKGKTFRYNAWCEVAEGKKNTLRSWFNVCEYCFHFFLDKNKNETNFRKTGLLQIYSNPECFNPLKKWYKDEIKRLGIDRKDIEKKYTEVTGKKPFMVSRHYFTDSQFEIPTSTIYNNVYIPLGFNKTYEELRKEYEELRPCHNSDANHCNVWERNAMNNNQMIHPCQKPVDLLERIIKVSTRKEGCVVLDPFMGSASTAIACINTGRKYIGFESDKEYYNLATKRINEHQLKLQL